MPPREVRPTPYCQSSPPRRPEPWISRQRQIVNSLRRSFLSLGRSPAYTSACPIQPRSSAPPRPTPEAEVVSRESGWVQIVDTLSGRSGWVESALVAPSAEGLVAASAEGQAATGTPPSQQVAEEALPKPSKKTQKAKPVAQALSRRAKQRSIASADYVARPVGQARRLAESRTI